jgi:hypothetical protein
LLFAFCNLLFGDMLQEPLHQTSTFSLLPTNLQCRPTSFS